MNRHSELPNRRGDGDDDATAKSIYDIVAIDDAIAERK